MQALAVVPQCDLNSLERWLLDSVPVEKNEGYSLECQPSEDGTEFLDLMVCVRGTRYPTSIAFGSKGEFERATPGIMAYLGRRASLLPK